MPFKEPLVFVMLAALLCGGEAVSVLQRRRARSQAVRRGLPSESTSGGDANSHPDAAHTSGHQRQLQKLFSRIGKELEPWRDGITLEMVERTYCSDFDKSFRFQIVNRTLFVAGEMTGFLEFNRVTKLFFLDVARHHKLPDVDIVFSTADGCPYPRQEFAGNATRCPLNAPLFSFDKQTGQDAHCVLFPDFTFGSGGWPLAKLPPWDDARDIMEQDSSLFESIPWSLRAPRLFFRGAPTGNRLDLSADRAFTADTGVDFRLTGWTGLTKAEEYVSLPEHCNYRYLLNLPGNGWSVRLKYLMLCGSTVIFPTNGWEEFWYHLLEDNVNVVLTPPITNQNRGSDVAAALRRMQIDLAKAEEIGAAGADLVRNILTSENVRRVWDLSLKSINNKTFIWDAQTARYSVMSADATYNIQSRSCAICANTGAGQGGASA